MRMRTIRPEFFVDEDLTTLDPLTRILFMGLWCIADREGRLEDKPVRIKLQILPVDDCDVDAMLDELAAIGVIHRYTCEGLHLVQVKSFSRYQRPHVKESASVLPAMPRKGSGEEQPRSFPARRELRTENGDMENGECRTESAPPSFSDLPECFSTEHRGRPYAALLYAELETWLGPTWVMKPTNRGSLGAAITAGCESCDGSCPGDCMELFARIIREKHDKPGLMLHCVKSDPRPWIDKR